VVDGKLETRFVQTGISDAENTEILSGLKPGDVVTLPAGVSVEEAGGGAEELPAGIR